MAQGGVQQAHNYMNQSPIIPNAPKPKKELPIMTARRLVQVFIADPDENVPLDQSMLYSGEQKLTDATDQELFFEIDMKSALEKHNAERIKLVNKKDKEGLKPIQRLMSRGNNRCGATCLMLAQKEEELAQAPQTVLFGDQLPEVERIEYSYKPVLGAVPPEGVTKNWTLVMKLEPRPTVAPMVTGWPTT
jgi:hypothetical protein